MDSFLPSPNQVLEQRLDKIIPPHFVLVYLMHFPLLRDWKTVLKDFDKALGIIWLRVNFELFMISYELKVCQTLRKGQLSGEWV